MISSQGSARARTIRRVLTGLMVCLGVGVLSWGAWQSFRSRPTLAEAIGLAEAGRLDEAEAKLRARLAADSDDGAANLLLAQLALKRSDSPATQAGRSREEGARLALDHLRGVHPSNPRMGVTFQLCRGRALDHLLRFDEAEAAWLEALKLDATAPEAGWHLLNLYYLQGREEDARRLALRLYEVEPDPHDRVLLLLELVRPDARPPAPGSIVKLFEPVVREHPDDLHSAVALGLARVRAGKVEAGIDELRRVVQTHPDRVEAWDCLLTGLDESGQIDVMEEELERLPAALAEPPRLVKHRARVAQGSNRWKEAVELYRRAQAAEPYNRAVEYRLSRALRHNGATAEADRIEQRLRRRDVAIQEVRPLYDQATTTSGLGNRPHPELYQRIAEARERMQLPDEARAWHRLVLRDDPKNAVSLAALERLGDQGDSR
jgi:tetratricopeptide (TPR) repeat protein